VSQSSIDISDIKSLADAISSLLEVFQVEQGYNYCVDFVLTTCSSKAVLLWRSVSVILSR